MLPDHRAEFELGYLRYRLRDELPWDELSVDTALLVDLDPDGTAWWDEAISAVQAAANRPMTDAEARESIAFWRRFTADAGDRQTFTEMPDSDICKLLADLLAEAHALRLVYALAVACVVWVDHDAVLLGMEGAKSRKPVDAPDGWGSAEFARLVREHAKRPMSAKMARLLTALVEAWSPAMLCHESLQTVIRKAFERASAMRERYGDDDMRTLSAVYEAMELQEPGCTMRMMRECGINLEPTHCGPNGEPLYSLDAVAASLDADPEELVEKVHELEGMGFAMRAGEAEANRLH